MELRPDWRILEATKQTLTFANEERSVRVSASDDLIMALVSHLASDEKIQNRERLTPLITKLADAGVLWEGRRLASRHTDQFERLRDYLACFVTDPDGALSKIHESHVWLLGLGGTGSIVLQHLVAAGVGSYTLVDSDTVAASNLNRQFVYRLKDVGRPKVEVCAEYINDRLAAARSTPMHCTITGSADIQRILDAAGLPSIALVAIDHPIDSIVEHTTSALSLLRIPYIVAGVGVRYGLAGEVKMGETDNRNFVGTSASISTTNTIASSYAAHRVLEHLLGAELFFRMREHGQAADRT